MSSRQMKLEDQAMYRRCSAPFASGDLANEALQAFFDDVKAARERHRIADVVVVCEVSHQQDEQEVRGSASVYLGDQAHVLPIIAREYGAARQRHEDQLASIIATARRSIRR